MLASAQAVQYNGSQAVRLLHRGVFQRGTEIVSDKSDSGIVEPVVETVRKQKARDDKRPKRQPRYNVILWDDQEHTPEYVIAMMRQLFGHPQEKGYQIAQEVDGRGRAIVLTTTREHAELKRDQIHSFGKDDQIRSCKGSMSASIEPVPE
jgi:ATP-dependent Clp protease adaptor protein ClpS